MKRELTLTRTVDAPMSDVWNAWTDPVEIATWWGPDGVTTTVETFELIPGGTLHLTMHAGETLGELSGQDWPLSGTFKEIVSQEKLVFSNNALAADGTLLLSGEATVAFAEEGGKTQITVTTSAEGDRPGVEQMLAGMEPGWNQQLNKLVQLLQTPNL